MLMNGNSSVKKEKNDDIKYTRTARVDKKDKVSIINDRLLQNSARYLKHRSYIDVLATETRATITTL